MKFDDLDKKMRAFETAHDHCVLPGIFMVARLDGRNFTQLTKKKRQFDVPFDEKFRDYMVQTSEHLINCGFNVIFAYTQSDEISLLFHPAEESFNRKMRKYNSILAGEASAHFSLLLNQAACFDCRICQLPTNDLVIDYFRWRNEDAHRNALNSYCYWMLRKEGLNKRSATGQLNKQSVAAKNELLFQRGVNFNDIPNWQKRGVGIYWQEYEKTAVNPKTGETVTAQRRKLNVDLNLPMKENYSQFIRELLIFHSR